VEILYASLLYPPSLGGGEIHLHELAKEVARRGHGVRIVTQATHAGADWTWSATVRCDTAETYAHEGIAVHRLGFDAVTRRRMRPWAFLYKQHVLRALAIRRIASAVRPYVSRAAAPATDVVHALRMGPPFLARASMLAGRRVGAPFVITALHHPDRTGSKLEPYAAILRAADAVVTLTEHERASLVREAGLRPERVHVTGVGPVLAREFSVDDLRRHAGISGRYVLFVGRKVRPKGWHAILGAAPQVFERHPDVTFVFVGEDDERSRLAFEAISDERVRNLGAVDLATKTAAIAGCELLCLPSTSESFGGVFTEAWTFGKPVIGGRIPPIAEVIDEGIDGLLSTQDAGDLAKSLLLLLGSPAEAARLGEAGRRKVAERYAWDRLAERTLAIYRSVLDARREESAAST
jgi:glycosyltransferase involved in cell wall biosynthesis